MRPNLLALRPVGSNGHVSVEYVIYESKLIPAVAAVPAGHPVDVIVVSGDHRQHRASVGSRHVVVPVDGSAALHLPARPPARYGLRVDGAAVPHVLVVR